MFIVYYKRQYRSNESMLIYHHVNLIIWKGFINCKAFLSKFLGLVERGVQGWYAWSCSNQKCCIMLRLLTYDFELCEHVCTDYEVLPILNSLQLYFHIISWEFSFCDIWNRMTNKYRFSCCDHECNSEESRVNARHYKFSMISTNKTDMYLLSLSPCEVLL